jgi:toxin-antitoxin system PIN domain toxin
MTRPGPTPGSNADLPDLNVWLALAVQEHPHHGAASHDWRQVASSRVCFCRVTMLGLVRLLTQPRLVGSAALVAVAASRLYERFAALPEIDVLPEPTGTGVVLRRLVDSALPARLLTDAYLASVAVAGGLRLVGFDRDFACFEGLNLSRLPVATTATGEDTMLGS